MSIEFKRVNKITPEINKLLEEAANDKYLGEIVFSKKIGVIYLFEIDGELVGFAIPRRESDGYFRTGPIYVRPKYRNKGIASNFVSSFFKHRKGRAYIDVTNKASQKIFIKNGFIKTNKTILVDDEILQQYLKGSDD